MEAARHIMRVNCLRPPFLACQSGSVASIVALCHFCCQSDGKQSCSPSCLGMNGDRRLKGSAPIWFYFSAATMSQLLSFVKYIMLKNRLLFLRPMVISYDWLKLIRFFIAFYMWRCFQELGQSTPILNHEMDKLCEFLIVRWTKYVTS